MLHGSQIWLPAFCARTEHQTLHWWPKCTLSSAVLWPAFGMFRWAEMSTPFEITVDYKKLLPLPLPSTTTFTFYHYLYLLPLPLPSTTTFTFYHYLYLCQHLLTGCIVSLCLFTLLAWRMYLRTEIPYICVVLKLSWHSTHENSTRHTVSAQQGSQWQGQTQNPGFLGVMFFCHRRAVIAVLCLSLRLSSHENMVWTWDNEWHH